jgi:hypothetical protein
MNLNIPATDSSGNAITSGNLYLELYGFDLTVPADPVLEVYNSQAIIPVNGSATSSTAALVPHVRRGPKLGPANRKIVHSHRRSPRAMPRPTGSTGILNLDGSRPNRLSQP